MSKELSTEIALGLAAEGLTDSAASLLGIVWPNDTNRINRIAEDMKTKLAESEKGLNEIKKMLPVEFPFRSLDELIECWEFYHAKTTETETETETEEETPADEKVMDFQETVLTAAKDLWEMLFNDDTISNQTSEDCETDLNQSSSDCETVVRTAKDLGKVLIDTIGIVKKTYRKEPDLV